MFDRIAEIIEKEVNRFPGEESLANAMRCAAWFVNEEFPDAKASDFGNVAHDRCGLHRQGAINRWNEAMKELATLQGTS